jgi:lantibiotic leader peptide-processing serine protease
MLRFGAWARPVGRANGLEGVDAQTPCPVPALFDYPEPNSVDALCEGTLQHNGFYGDGIVNALTASLR